MRSAIFLEMTVQSQVIYESEYLMFRKSIACVFTAIVAGCFAAVGRCQESTPPERTGLPVRIESLHLPNPVQVHQKVISGGLPESEAAFRELAALGVKTIISVDGMKPDVELARKHGMRYVHLPHGYDGIPEGRKKELAKAVRDLQGAVYVHCHHGKHRSPAAASVACVAAGLIQPEQAVPVLQLAGTNPNYRGLFKDVRDARPLTSVELDRLFVEFREVQDIPAMAEAMVEIAEVHEKLEQIAAAKWKTPSDHPDLEPAHEALLLRELLAELLRQEKTARHPAEFLNMLGESAAAAAELHERLLKMHDQTATTKSQLSELDSFTKCITDNCKACHATFRDIPLDEKR